MPAANGGIVETMSIRWTDRGKPGWAERALGALRLQFLCAVSCVALTQAASAESLREALTSAYMTSPTLDPGLGIQVNESALEAYHAA